MGNGVRMETEPSHFLSRLLIIFFSCGVRKQEFCATFGSISLHGNDNRRPDENSLVAGLRSDQSTFLNAVAFAQFGWNDDCPAFAHFDSVHDIRISEYRAFTREGQIQKAPGPLSF